jgi:predicted DNA-binding transcriptional regulator AlpA
VGSQRDCLFPDPAGGEEGVKLDLEPQDIEAIARRTADLLRPFLSTSQDQKDRILDINGLAEYLTVTPKWIYSNKRAIPHFKLKGQLRFRRSEIDSWMNKNRVPATAPFPRKSRLRFV